MTTEPTGPAPDDDVPAEDPAELEDLAAEIDDDPDDAGSVTGPANDPAIGADEPVARAWWAGTVTIGPERYVGRMIVSRYPDGVVLVDRPANTVWLLDRVTDGTFVARDRAGVTLDDELRWIATNGDTWDVRAYDDEFGGDELPDAAPTPAGVA